jgi:hypothetical protein
MPAVDLRTEQRYAIKLCVRLGKTGTETFEMMKCAYKENCLSRCRVFEWHKKFSEGCESIEDPRKGRPSTSWSQSNISQINELIKNDCHISLRNIAAAVGICYGVVRCIVHDELSYRKVATKWIR